MKDGNFTALYAEVSAREQDAKDVLIAFERNYPGVTTESNVNDIIKSLKERQKNPPVLEKLRKYQTESQQTSENHPTRNADSI